VTYFKVHSQNLPQDAEQKNTKSSFRTVGVRKEIRKCNLQNTKRECHYTKATFGKIGMGYSNSGHTNFKVRPLRFWPHHYPCAHLFQIRICGCKLSGVKGNKWHTLHITQTKMQIHIYLPERNQYSNQYRDYRMDWTTRVRFPVAEFFLLATTSRPVLRTIHPPIQQAQRVQMPGP